MSREFQVRLKPGVTVAGRTGSIIGQVATFDVDEGCFWFLLRGQPGALGQPHGHRIPFDACHGVFCNSEDHPGAFEGENMIQAWRRWHAKEGGR